MRRFRAFLPLLALTAASCADPDAGARNLREARDGTVESDAPAWTARDAWRVDTADALGIGAAQGDTAYVFGEVAGAARLSDGRIVVADGQGSLLRHFDARGRHLRTVGRKGAGPGEFEGLMWVAECGADSVFVYDFVLRRISVFAPNGDFARSFVPETPVHGRGPSSLACSGGGPMVVSTRTTEAVERAVGPHRLRAPVALVSREGTILRDFGEFPGPDRYRHERSDGPLPFGKTLSIATHGGRVFIGTADTYEIGVFSPDGTQRTAIRLRGGQRRVTREERDRYVAEQLARVRDPNRRRAQAAWYRDLQFPEFYPAFSSLQTDSDGNLWVEEYRRPSDRQPRWSVFDPSGRYLGTLTMPAGFTVFQVGRDFVLGSRVDSLGVARVVRYGLRKP